MTISAVPARREIWRTLKLADGSEVRAELRGDEFLSFWQAADGRRFVPNVKTGIFEAADSGKLATQAQARRNMPSMLQSRLRIAFVPFGGTHTEYKGKKKGLIILVQFADKTFSPEDTPELYNRIANEENFNEMGFEGSVKDYFKAQSYGDFELDFDVVGPVTMPEGYAYYGANYVEGSNVDFFHSQAVGQMLIDACTAVDGQVNFKDYDWDGDGMVDQVYLLYAGHGEATYDDPNTIWPHEAGLDELTYDPTTKKYKTLQLDGVYINTYACGCELGHTESIYGIGTICHEFSHCLGLPDMYDITYSGYYGMGSWSVMDQGLYNGNSFVPADYTSYERWYAGWIEPKVLDSDVQVDDMKPIENDKDAYIIYNNGNPNEYYLLENRQKDGWDAAIPGSGMLILHVDYSDQVWSSDSVNSTSRQRCTVFPADNDLNNPAGDTYPYMDNNSLNDFSTPAAMLNNKNSDGTYYMNKSVSEITQNDDGTMAFKFETNEAAEDYEKPSSYIFYESFDKMDGQGGHDGLFDGSTVGKGTFKGYTDNDGWSSISGYGADKCVMLGSSDSIGQITTPELELNGKYTLYFKAAPYTGDGNFITVEVKSGEASFTKTNFIMTEGRWSAFSTEIEGNGPMKLLFKGTQKFFFDEVCIAPGSTTGINSVTVEKPSQPADGRIYGIDGQYMGKNLDNLKKGIYIVNRKKIIK
ncbi:MAG: M6 family metalloprotease domain-containing protein [Paraprevotella sp.]|nr:M6 family metalloprotease domain-containing protein [Paraprevotella sp.]